MTATSEIPALSDAPANRTPATFDPDTAPDTDVPANRSFVITWLLSMLFGVLGLDRIYTGRYLTGALKLLSLGGLGIWWIIDLGIVLAGGLRYGRDPLRGYAQDKEIAWIATGFTLIVAYSLQVDEMVATLLSGLF
ncbi:TM2 domain-containing protein [Brevibacterium siliguriense]|uniref:TM2 domain-containing protein n=1 Tax=Brevibacterium siliguriense TaxID=1136497 RepID=A0A1H1NNS8_9MICO|nr:TM2 domain-containing protein [Brevibacterium siliguriense]SDS00553.1 TM2 domain-containing protein [Brevibacterium siliguriense]